MINTTEKKRKQQKAEDFIGWKSPDGRLEVIGIAGKQGTNTTFKVTCTECSKDKELFPDGYFISTKGDLIKSKKPCRCSKFNWEYWQFLVLAKRSAGARFIVHGFSEEFHGQKTKLNLECLKDGHKWTARSNDIINGGTGCPKCSGVYRPTEQEALQKCIDICKEMGYDAIGFVDGYKGVHKTRFEYICRIHGKQSVIYGIFINNGTRCMGCWKDKQLELLRDNGNGNGYYPERKDETDFLYILDFDGKFIKVGRSFDVDKRIKGLRTLSKVSKKKIYKLRIFTATHQEIYDYEQELHNELREHNFQHFVDWSTECFENDSLLSLNKLLDNCKLTEIDIRG